MVLTDAEYQAIDMITGQSLEIKRSGNVLQIQMTIKGAWGRVILLCPNPPANIKASAKVNEGKLTYNVHVLDNHAKPVGMPALCHITVTDPQGNDHFEYGGRLVTDEGKLTRSLPLPINELKGTWTITVTEATSQSKTQTTFKIQ